MADVPLGTESLHGSIRLDRGEIHGRLTVGCGPVELVLDATDPDTWLQLASVAGDIASQLTRAQDAIRRRHPSVEKPYVCGRCQQASERLVLVATGDQRVAISVCVEHCADEIIPTTRRDRLGRLVCCGAGPDRRDPRTGEDLHLPGCKALEVAS